MAVKEAGATALRGGAFKPRTSPYSFQGLKEDGLKLLADGAQQETGLAIVTEVVSPEDVELVSFVRRRAADRRPQHAELPAAGGLRQAPTRRCC